MTVITTADLLDRMSHLTSRFVPAEWLEVESFDQLGEATTHQIDRGYYVDWAGDRNKRTRRADVGGGLDADHRFLIRLGLFISPGSSVDGVPMRRIALREILQVRDNVIRSLIGGTDTDVAALRILYSGSRRIASSQEWLLVDVEVVVTAELDLSEAAA